jgi:hypothetical protein
MHIYKFFKKKFLFFFFSSKFSDFIAKVTSVISESTISDIPVGIFDNQEIIRNKLYKKLHGKHW